MADREKPHVRPADLIREGGIAGNAADLIDAVYSSTPGPLQKALLLRHHRLLHSDDGVDTPELKLAQVAKSAGLEKVKAAEIHGGQLDDAWVVYVAEDHLGSNYYGALPYEQCGGSGIAKDHISEAESFEQSDAGQRLVEQREAQDEASGVSSTRKPKPAQPSGDD